MSPDIPFQAYFILAGSLVSEGATWLVAFNSIRRGAKEVDMSVKDYSKWMSWISANLPGICENFYRDKLNIFEFKKWVFEVDI